MYSVQLEALQPTVYRNIHEYGNRYCLGVSTDPKDFSFWIMFYLRDFQVCYSQIIDAGELWFVSRVKQPSGTPCPCEIDSDDPETEERCVV